MLVDTSRQEILNVMVSRRQWVLSGYDGYPSGWRHIERCPSDSQYPTEMDTDSYCVASLRYTKTRLECRLVHTYRKQSRGQSGKFCGDPALCAGFLKHLEDPVIQERSNVRGADTVGNKIDAGIRLRVVVAVRRSRLGSH